MQHHPPSCPPTHYLHHTYRPTHLAYSPPSAPVTLRCESESPPPSRLKSAEPPWSNDEADTTTATALLPPPPTGLLLPLMLSHWPGLKSLTVWRCKNGPAAAYQSSSSLGGREAPSILTEAGDPSVRL